MSIVKHEKKFISSKARQQQAAILFVEVIIGYKNPHQNFSVASFRVVLVCCYGILCYLTRETYLIRFFFN